ncbi:hypothetical protein [Caballeronia sp. LZ016]|uniref:hypothetical protein n=1 Tax=Caballeronia sp. LZ016 TaxID=3038554 RepID=UPI00285F5F45|nr:hypothetical protein [Caballeronia sp. LZ016]MDR5739505.1 hypothetical protein [Caballeronia sp. LZ016]
MASALAASLAGDAFGTHGTTYTSASLAASFIDLPRKCQRAHDAKPYREKREHGTGDKESGGTHATTTQSITARTAARTRARFA